MIRIKVKREVDRQNLAKAPAEAQTIKIADLIANTPSIVEHDVKFAKTYIPEKEALLSVLGKGDDRLWCEAYQMLNRAKHSLKIK